MKGNSLPKGWRLVKFGDLVRKVNNRVDPESSGISRYVAGEHMDSDNLNITRWGTVGDGYLGPAFTMRFQPGQVLYGSRRTYLRKVALADFEGICANTTFVLETKSDDLLQEYLPHVMSTEKFHAHSISKSKGSVNPYINFVDLNDYEFALPPIAEQHRIIKLISTIDVIATTYLECPFEQLTRAILQENLFDERARHPGAKLGEIAQVQAGFAFKSSQFSSTEGIPLIRIRDLGGDGTTEILFDGEYGLDFEVHHRDLLIGMDGEFRCHRWSGGKALLNQRLCRVRSFNEAVVVPEYVYFLLNLFLKEIENTTPSTTVKHISTKQIEKIEIPLPPIDIQFSLVEKLEAIVELELLAGSECRNVRLIRSNLLNRKINNV